MIYNNKLTSNIKSQSNYTLNYQLHYDSIDYIIILYLFKPLFIYTIIYKTHIFIYMFSLYYQNYKLFYILS
jgi:hypothetical protein